MGCPQNRQQLNSQKDVAGTKQREVPIAFIVFRCILGFSPPSGLMLTFWPTALTAPMITTVMRPATNRYSMATTAHSSNGRIAGLRFESHAALPLIVLLVSSFMA